jgi:hypothetical protein
MGIQTMAHLDTSNNPDSSANRHLRLRWPHRLNILIEKGVAVLIENFDSWLEKNFEKMTAAVLEETVSEEDLINDAIDREKERQLFDAEMNKLDTESYQDNLNLDFHEVVGPLRQHDGNGHRPPQLPM